MERLKQTHQSRRRSLDSEDKPAWVAIGIDALPSCRTCSTPGSLGGSPDLPGDGRRRQGRRDQARHVGRQSARVSGALNRSYYEETLVVRVHPELLAAQQIPAGLVTKRVWQERFEDIRDFERYLGRNGVAICKFFLHVSKKEQKKRFLERLENADKNWKFSANDAKEREHWNAYMAAYEDMIRSTATEAAPWYVVPADNKWFTRLVVCAAVIETLAGLDLAYPRVDKAKKSELAAARRVLRGGK